LLGAELLRYRYNAELQSLVVRFSCAHVRRFSVRAIGDLEFCGRAGVRPPQARRIVGRPQILPLRRAVACSGTFGFQQYRRGLRWRASEGISAVSEHRTPFDVRERLDASGLREDGTLRTQRHRGSARALRGT